MGHGTRKEPGIEIGKNKEEKKASAPHIPGVPDALLNDWLAVRKAKRAGPLTATAVAALHREAGKAQLTVADAVQFCCEASWLGFNADWYAQRSAKRLVSNPQRSGETDWQRSQREKVEKFTGGLVSRKHPDTIDKDSHVPAALRLGR